MFFLAVETHRPPSLLVVAASVYPLEFKSYDVHYLLMSLLFIVMNGMNMLEKQEYVLKNGHSEPFTLYIYEYSTFILVFLIAYTVYQFAIMFPFALSMAKFSSLIMRVN